MEIDIVRIICNDKYLNIPFYNQCRNEVFRLRYNVYCREMGVIESNEEEEIRDEFDSFKRTVIFAARIQDRVVGTIRLVKYDAKNSCPLLLEHTNMYEKLKKKLDFERKISGGRQFTEASRFALLREYRRSNSSNGRLISIMLMLDYINYCKDYKLTDIIGISNPKLLNFYQKIAFRPLFSIKDELTGIESPVIYGEVNRVGAAISKLKIKVKLIELFDQVRRFIVEWIR